jgi:hypothetical protein
MFKKKSNDTPWAATVLDMVANDVIQGQGRTGRGIYGLPNFLPDRPAQGLAALRAYLVFLVNVDC